MDEGSKDTWMKVCREEVLNGCREGVSTGVSLSDTF